MSYDFFADQIDLGIDDTEEVISVRFTASDPDGGPASSYLLLQRSVVGLDDADLKEPYFEIDDPSNAGFARAVEFAELFPQYLHLRLAASQAPTSTSGEPVHDVVVRFQADAALHRRLRYALALVVADGFPLRFMS